VTPPDHFFADRADGARRACALLRIGCAGRAIDIKAHKYHASVTERFGPHDVAQGSSIIDRNAPLQPLLDGRTS
jgi:hypothetical protein